VVTWSTLRTRISRKLNDADMRSYSASILLDAVNDALSAFASGHTGIASTFTLTGDGTTSVFDLPSNIVDTEAAGIVAVQWLNNKWLPRFEYFPGTDLPNDTISTSTAPVGYVLWPADQITFTRIPKDEASVILKYIAYYSVVALEADEINIPRWAEEAVVLYASAVSMEPTATKTGKVRTYASRRDAGAPEDNPGLMLSNHYMHRYQMLLLEHPAPQYAKLQPIQKDHY